MKTLSNYSKVLLGKNDGQNIYLTPPSWDCGWYWGFGYIGNRDCHYHIDGLKKIETYNPEKGVFTYEFVNLYDGLKKHFGDTFIVKREKDVWTIAELFKSFYILKETAEVLKNGSAHLTTNPCAYVIMNLEEVERINNIVLPQIFEEIYKILNRNADSETTFNELVAINVEGDPEKVLKFMKSKQISTDDLKNIKGLTAHDISKIHSYYWADFHKNKAN